ncbi:MFS general substrate transporter [Coniophora puteana RWD-64-598 SS2]|uniref:MFS general substrate transporter n=1 Tax=Coniophora puteana (strain RWD-64-598) TaxID=741705 RepID=A0A5M3MSB3_CONPW|nr:MFS general substrate transporter [Coniophora puteana RWD-64-598 SS2]EIW82048.1 MFS general substrate transporter [Coniophora puteana RWD-64-598 SS2]
MSSAFKTVPYSRLPHGNLEDGEQDDNADDTLLRHSDERVKLEKQLLRKLDARMAILVLIYILNYIDRNNAAAARLHGFEEDLHLEGQQFNTILSILYVGYILMQIPSNMFLNHIGKPSIYLPACMTVWGVISVLTGTTTSYTGALTTRFLIGFVEAAFFPGALFLLSKWYKRRELGLRTAILSCGNMISQAFGSLLASVILERMDGVLGYAGWRWLFYIEGSMTVVVAIAAMFILPDFPTTSAGWLTEEERALAQLRLEEDVGVGDQQETEPEKDQPSGLVLALTDWKVWWLAVALLFMVISLSFNAFFPTLSATMGYSYTVSLLLCSPPWMFSTALALWPSRRSDRLGERFWHITFPLLFGILGFLIAGFTMNTAARYLSLFLMAQSYAGFIVFVAWISNSIPRPPSKRAVALAFVNSLSSLGNVVGSYAWLTEWGPSYRMSCLICIAASSAGIVMSWMFRQHLHRLNVEAERREEAAGQPKGFRYLI